MWAIPSKSSPRQSGQNSPHASRKNTQQQEETGARMEPQEQRIDSSTQINEVDKRRAALEAKLKARFEKENKRLEEENLLNTNLSEEKQLELLSQVEELRGRKSQLEITAPTISASEMARSTPLSKYQQHQHSEVKKIESKLNEIGEAKKRRSDERKLRELKNEEQERKKNENIEKKRLQGIIYYILNITCITCFFYFYFVFIFSSKLLILPFLFFS